jgi:hypothetical protein
VFFEAIRDFACCLICKCEGADLFWIDVSLFDQESYSLDQAEGLACAGAGEDQDRAGLSFYRS